MSIKDGRMENSTFYENNISNELNKLQQDKDIIETNYIKNIDDYDSIVNNYSKKITELENFRSNIIKNINNLSYNNYNSNYVKINLLRNNLNNINKELEMNRNNILKFIFIMLNLNLLMYSTFSIFSSRTSPTITIFLFLKFLDKFMTARSDPPNALFNE